MKSGTVMTKTWFLKGNYCEGTWIPPTAPGVTQPIVGVYFTALYCVLASSRRRFLDHTQ